MSKIALSGNASGTGVLTIAAPNTNSDRTLTLPDSSGTLLNNSSTAGFPAGSVLQVINHRNSASNGTTSTTFVATNSTATITPTSASSKILIITNSPLYVNADNGHIYTTIYRNSTNVKPGNDELQLFSAGTSGTGRWTNGSMSFLDSPSTTSAVTYTVYFKQGVAGTAYYDGNGGMALMTLMEIAA